MNPWVRAACGRDPLRSMRETRGGTSELQRRPLKAILAGFDVHRAQITFDALDTETGEVLRGRFRADREAVGAWAGQLRDVTLLGCLDEGSLHAERRQPGCDGPTAFRVQLNTR